MFFTALSTPCIVIVLLYLTNGKMREKREMFDQPKDLFENAYLPKERALN